MGLFLFLRKSQKSVKQQRVLFFFEKLNGSRDFELSSVKEMKEILKNKFLNVFSNTYYFFLKNPSSPFQIEPNLHRLPISLFLPFYYLPILLHKYPHSLPISPLFQASYYLSILLHKCPVLKDKADFFSLMSQFISSVSILFFNLKKNSLVEINQTKTFLMKIGS